MSPETTKFGRKNNAKYGPFRRSRSFKVTDFSTNRKLIYDFLLVINTNLRRLRGDLIEVFKIFKGFDDVKPIDFFTISSTGLRGHELKLYKP